MEYHKLVPTKYQQLAFFASRPRNMCGQIRRLMYVSFNQTDSYLIKCFADFRLLFGQSITALVFRQHLKFVKLIKHLLNLRNLSDRYHLNLELIYRDIEQVEN